MERRSFESIFSDPLVIFPEQTVETESLFDIDVQPPLPDHVFKLVSIPENPTVSRN